MFKPVKAKSAKEYFSLLPKDRHDQLMFLDRLIRKTVPKLKPVFVYNMPGYGTFKYTNYKKEVIDWPVVAIASQKNYISVYVCAIQKGQYLAEKYKEQLGKVSVGRSCIRFKNVDDLNLKTLGKVLKEAARSPGLVEST